MYRLQRDLCALCNDIAWHTPALDIYIIGTSQERLPHVLYKTTLVLCSVYRDDEDAGKKEAFNNESTHAHII